VLVLFLNKSDILERLRELDLKSEGVSSPTEVLIVGGSALALLGELRLTSDFDYLGSLDYLPKEYLASLGFSNNVKTFFALYGTDEYTALELNGFKNLTVKVLSYEDLAVMKLFSTRIKDLEDLKERFGRIVIGCNLAGEPVYVHQLGCQGAMALLMKDAIKPNLVQTLEHTPAIVHGGPFANIAHGCNSIVATKLGLKLGDIVVTEAGFGADLGAEKFLDIKCRYGDIFPDTIVIVATLRALKMHGGVPKQELSTENVEAVTKGFSNLQKAIENMRYFNVPVLVAINKFATDTDAEIAELTRLCDEFGVPVELNECWEKGGEGGTDMAKKVVELLEGPKPTPKFVYDLEDSLEEKVNKIVKTIYGGDGVIFTDKAKKQIKQLADWGLDRLPVCMAKTQYSLSDNPALLGAPKGFTITVSDIRVANGAGFIVCRTGDVMVMPGLPKRPAALNMDIEADGTIKGLF